MKHNDGDTICKFVRGVAGRSALARENFTCPYSVSIFQWKQTAVLSKMKGNQGSQPVTLWIAVSTKELTLYYELSIYFC